METLTLGGRHAAIGAVGAFIRQFRMLWTSRRPIMLLVGVLGALALAGQPWASGETARLVQIWPLLVVVIGPVWAFAVFHNEGPGNRYYHWSQPVGRWTHTVTRLVAGLAWLWTVYAVLVGAAYLLAGVDGNAWQLGHVPLIGWVNLFTGPLLGYLVVSLLTVGSDFPIRWFFGILFLVPITMVLITETLGLEKVVQVLLRPLADERWGLAVTLIGGMTEGITQVHEQIARHSGGNASRHHHFDLSVWGWATALWTAGLAGLVAAAASWHPDRLPSLRRAR